jgi:glycosyltransferase involved in cell wall biosynthesis
LESHSIASEVSATVRFKNLQKPMMTDASTNTGDSRMSVSGSVLAPPQVSVLMLTRNRPQFLGRAIRSVIEQNFEDWELIIVQDGMDQETAAVMDHWLKLDPRIRHFRRDQGGNIANASNYGLARAGGEYVAVLDDDDFWVDADKLTKQVAFLKSNPDYSGCGGGWTVIDVNENIQMPVLKPEQDNEIRARALYTNPMHHSTTMFRRTLGEGFGYYDETLVGYQDWDIWLCALHALERVGVFSARAQQCAGRHKDRASPSHGIPRVRGKPGFTGPSSCLRASACQRKEVFFFVSIAAEKGDLCRETEGHRTGPHWLKRPGTVST